MRGLRAEGREGRTVRLSWRAGGSALPAPVAVQHRADSTAAWSKIGVVETAGAAQTANGAGPAYRFETGKLAVGTHRFRLVYTPLEEAGRSGETSKVVTARIGLDGEYELSAYPNPVRDRATVELAVRESQDVTVRLYDVLGRRVATLRDGPLPAQQTKRLRLGVSATGLTSGTYFLRVRGETFSATRRLTVVR